MSPGKYTELFFLDEATAFATGHRPCQECRRDAIIHAERITPDGKKGMHIEQLDRLLFPWNPEGYGPPIERPKEKPVMVLTPASIVNAFRAGYTPQMAIPG
jgi:hypothetical protein